MKAEIDATGTLFIEPETALETYALRQWHAHWRQASQPVEYRQIGKHSCLLVLQAKSEQRPFSDGHDTVGATS